MSKKELSDYWYPRYPSRWGRKTMHLCPYQDGLYGRLVDHYMETKEALPDADAALARICGVSPADFAPHSAVIRAFFQAKKGRLFNKTCEEILAFQNGSASRRSESASKAAKILWEKKKKIQEDESATHTSRDAEPMRPDATEQNITEDKKELIKEDTKDIFGIPAKNANAAGGEKVSREIFTEAVELFNAMAEGAGISTVQKLTDARKKKLAARLKDCGGLEGWKAALEKVAGSAFLTGKKTNWKADFDFIVTESKFTKIMEGSYNDLKSAGANRPKSPQESLAAGFDLAVDMLNMADGKREQ